MSARKTTTKSTDEITATDIAVDATAVSVDVTENIMYVGPTITGIVRYSTVFKGGILPAKVSACIEQMPIMKNLFVPLSKLAEANKELSKDQSALKTISARVAKKFTGR